MTCHESADKSLDVLVDDMLLDAGAAGDAELRAALLSLGSLAALPAPAPSGDLAKLMATAGQPSGSPGDAPGDELARRRRRRTIHRPTLLGIALIAGMGTGIGGVAASSPAPGQSGSLSVQALLADWSPSWSLSAPAPAPVTATPAEAEVPEVPEQPVQATQPGPLASSTPLPDPSYKDPDGQVTARQQPSAGRPGAAPDAAARASESGGARGKDIAEAPGRASVELPVPAGIGSGQADQGLPADPDGTAAAGESGLTGSLVKPLAEVLRPVPETAVADKPVPLKSWLQKFQR
jgi:hypothetical protein